MARTVSWILFIVGSLVAITAAWAQSDEYSTATRPDPEGTPTRVGLRVVVNDVSAIDDVDQTFDADIFYAFTWRDSRLASPQRRVMELEEVWHPRMLIVNLRASTLTLPTQVEVEADGTVEYIQRVIGTFASPLDLRRFPKDVQQLKLQVASYWYGPGEVQLETGSDKVGALGSYTSVGWNIAVAELVAGTIHSSLTGRNFVQAVLSFRAERISEYYRYTMLVPLFLIVAMAWTVFWIDPAFLPSQIGVSTASIFTLIAFRLSLRLILPPTAYMTDADKFLLGCTVLVFLALGQAITTGRLAKTGREKLAERMDRWGRWVYLIAFLAIYFVMIG